MISSHCAFCPIVTLILKLFSLQQHETWKQQILNTGKTINVFFCFYRSIHWLVQPNSNLLVSCFLIPTKVNDINFENMSNDDAVRVLREIVHKPGSVVFFSFDFILERFYILFAHKCSASILIIVYSMFARPIILTVAKCWDPSPQGYFTLPRSKYTVAGFTVWPRAELVTVS